MNRQTLSSKAINILSVAELQQIRSFRLEEMDTPANTHPVLSLIDGLSSHGESEQKPLEVGRSSCPLMRKLVKYMTMRIAGLIAASITILFLHFSSMSTSPLEPLPANSVQLTVSAATLRLLYWVLGPAIVLLDRCLCLAYIRLFPSVSDWLSTEAGAHRNGAVVILVYWQLMGDTLLTAFVLLLAAAPAVLYRLHLVEIFVPVALSGLGIMLNTVTGLKLSSPLHPSFTSWTRTLLSQRISTACTFFFLKFRTFAHSYSSAFYTCMLVLAFFCICFLSTAIPSLSTQLSVERVHVEKSSVSTKVSSPHTSKSVSAQQRAVRATVRRSLNGTYSALIAAMSIFLPIYMTVRPTKDTIADGSTARQNNKLVVLGLSLYALLVCLLQSRALLCFLRRSREWDRRVEPYFIFYPLATMLLSKVHWIGPMGCYWTLIYLSVFMHFSFVSSIYKEIKQAFNLSPDALPDCFS